MKTLVYTSFDCLLKLKNKDIVLDKNEYANLEDISSFFVYPTGKQGLIPFEVNLEKETAFYRIVKKDDRTLIFLINGIFAENIEKHSFSYNGKTCDVEISPSKICFSTKKRKKILSIPCDSKNFSCDIIFHIVYIKFSTDDEECIILFNIHSSSSKIFYGKKIQLEKDGFLIENNYSKQSFLIDKDGLKIKESKSFGGASHSSQMVATSFLQAIKDYDYSTAFAMLSPSLSSSQSEQNLKDFFGEISYIYSLDPYTIFAISNGKNSIFTF